jgi:hypothetical protein
VPLSFEFEFNTCSFTALGSRELKALYIEKYYLYTVK